MVREELNSLQRKGEEKKWRGKIAYSQIKGSNSKYKTDHSDFIMENILIFS